MMEHSTPAFASAASPSSRTNASKRSIDSGLRESRCRSDMKSVDIARLLGDERDALDDDRLDREVARERAAGAGRDVPDLVHDLHALDDLAEYRVAPASRTRVQVEVVVQVDIELTRRGVRLVRACHADRAAQVAQPVAGLVRHGLLGGLRLEIRREAAALREKALYHAVEDRAGVEALVDVLEKELHRQRGALRLELDDEAPAVRVDPHGGLVRCVERERGRDQRREEDRATYDGAHGVATAPFRVVGRSMITFRGAEKRHPSGRERSRPMNATPDGPRRAAPQEPAVRDSDLPLI